MTGSFRACCLSCREKPPTQRPRAWSTIEESVYTFRCVFKCRRCGAWMSFVAQYPSPPTKPLMRNEGGIDRYIRGIRGGDA